jgi:hypothetical protein
MIAITLVEDVAVVVLTILMPVVVSLSPSHLLGVGKALGLAALILVPSLFWQDFWFRQCLLASLLATCLGTAVLAEAVALLRRSRIARSIRCCRYATPS